MKKFKIKYAELYITNVCNLNCNNCNRFNNFVFKGQELWGDYYNEYQQWANRLEIEQLSILGGEPMLNPTFIEWFAGALAMWPTSKISVVTNGTQLRRWPGLYDILLANKERAFIEITMHSVEAMPTVLDDLTAILTGPINKTYNRTIFSDSEWQRMWNTIRGSDWPDCDNADDFINMPDFVKIECENRLNLGHQLWTDSNGVVVHVSCVTKFFTNAIKSQLPIVKLHDSNPVRSASICISKHCHHFSHGKLYKCGVSALLPEFIQQFQVDIENKDKELINNYIPANPHWDDKSLEQFINNLNAGFAIDQCKFCPETYQEIEFEADTKKIKLPRVSNAK